MQRTREIHLAHEDHAKNVYQAKHNSNNSAHKKHMKMIGKQKKFKMFRQTKNIWQIFGKQKTIEVM
jgi:hypothetical protein